MSGTITVKPEDMCIFLLKETFVLIFAHSIISTVSQFYSMFVKDQFNINEDIYVYVFHHIGRL